MLDQLIESSSGSKSGARRGKFLLTTFVLVFAICFTGVVWSLTEQFNNYFKTGLGGDLDLSSLVQAVPVADEPPPPEVKKPEEKKVVNADVRKEIIQDMNESPKVPDEISFKKSDIPPRRADKITILGNENTTNENAAPVGSRGTIDNNSKGVGGPEKTTETTDDAPPPEKKATPQPTKEIPKIVSGGVVNGKAVNLVKPPYPPAARAVRASGSVSVQVTIDENGNVISASAVSGHPLLKQAAEQAARSSKFSPTLLSGQKVKVSGVIIYNFTAQ